MQHLDLEKLKTPTADGARQKKFSISPAAEKRLKRAAKATGRTMSEIVEMLITEGLPDAAD